MNGVELNGMEWNGMCIQCVRRQLKARAPAHPIQATLDGFQVRNDDCHEDFGRAFWFTVL